MSKPTTNWRELITVHPAAEMFPMMPAEELKTLAGDIEANGLTNQVTTWVDKEGTEWLLDGRNRLDAMALAGYQFRRHSGEYIKSGRRRRQREWSERFAVFMPGIPFGYELNYVRQCSAADPYAYVISANIHRRHLTLEQRRELAAKLLKADPAQSNRMVAKQVKLSKTTVQAVRGELQAGGQIDHVETRTGADGKKQPTRRRARKTNNKPAERETDLELDKLAANGTQYNPASVETTQREPSTPAAQPPGTDLAQTLLLLPFNQALAAVTDWFDLLPLPQQNEVLSELKAARAVPLTSGELSELRTTIGGATACVPA